MSVKPQSLFFQASLGIPPPRELLPLPLPIERFSPQAVAAPPLSPIMRRLDEISDKLDDVLKRLKKK